MSDERKTYSGRLSFDPDSHFHLTEAGEPVFTPDNGKTWFYAEIGDMNHYDRYHTGEHQSFKTTAQAIGEAIAAGVDPAEAVAAHPHDAITGVNVPTIPDALATKATSHTEAWS